MVIFFFFFVPPFAAPPSSAASSVVSSPPPSSVVSGSASGMSLAATCPDWDGCKYTSYSTFSKIFPPQTHTLSLSPCATFCLPISTLLPPSLLRSLFPFHKTTPFHGQPHQFPPLIHEKPCFHGQPLRIPPFIHENAPFHGQPHQFRPFVHEKPCFHGQKANFL